MKKLTGTQKGAIGFASAIVAAALYVFSMTMGWLPNWLADEPKNEKAAKTEQVALTSDTAKPAVEAKATEVKAAADKEVKKVEAKVVDAAKPAVAKAEATADKAVKAVTEKAPAKKASKKAKKAADTKAKAAEEVKAPEKK